MASAARSSPLAAFQDLITMQQVRGVVPRLDFGQRLPEILDGFDIEIESNTEGHQYSKDSL